MTNYGNAALQMYAAAGGFSFSQMPIMAAIAQAESSGDPSRVNSIGATGLWQINQPVWVKQHPTWTQAALKNPVFNARAAKTVFDVQGYSAWETYTNGAYKQYLQSGNLAAGQQGTALGSPDIFAPSASGISALEAGKATNEFITGTSNGLSVNDALSKGYTWISDRNNTFRIIWVVLGGVVLLVSLNKLTRPITQPVVQTVKKTAKVASKL